MSCATKPATLAEGIHEGLPFEDYLALPYISNSGMGILLEQTPRHYREARFRESPALAVGSAVHAATLEPEAFAQRYFVAGEARPNFSTNKGKDLREAARNQAAGRYILWQDEMEEIAAMRDAIFAHPGAANLLRGAKREVTGIFREPAFGCRIKVRWDAFRTLGGRAVLLSDIKTTEDASPEEFSRAMLRYGYHRQAALYYRAAEVLGFDPSPFSFICVEKSPPYCVAVYRVEEPTMRVGLQRVMEALRTYTACVALDEWKGWPDDPQPIGIPEYALPQVFSGDK